MNVGSMIRIDNLWHQKSSPLFVNVAQKLPSILQYVSRYVLHNSVASSFVHTKIITMQCMKIFFLLAWSFWIIFHTWNGHHSHHQRSFVSHSFVNFFFVFEHELDEKWLDIAFQIVTKRFKILISSRKLFSICRPDFLKHLWDYFNEFLHSVMSKKIKILLTALLPFLLHQHPKLSEKW